MSPRTVIPVTPLGRRRLLAGTAAAGLATAGLAVGTGRAAATTTVPILSDGSYAQIPRRVLDTRSDPVSAGGGRFTAGTERTIVVDIEPGPVLSGNHVFLVVTVTQTSGSGHLIVYPADMAYRPVTSCANWYASGQTLASSILTRCQVRVSTVEPARESVVKIFCGGSGSAHVILDLTARWRDQSI